MKAWVLEDIGKIQYKEVSKPLPGEHEVLVEVKAAGICGPGSADRREYGCKMAE